MKVTGQPNPPTPPPRKRVAATPEPQREQDTFQSSDSKFPGCVIEGEESLTPEQRLFVRSTIDRAVNFFAQNFGEVTRPLVLRVDDTKRALRTGYSAREDTINFPFDDNGKRPGLDSADILVHEAFHALVGQAYPHLVTPERVRESRYSRLHEGLADYFTHLLYPDEEFAEGMGASGGPLRNFRNGRRVSLSPGGHSQGNAITSYLLRHQVKPEQIRGFLAGKEFSLRALSKVSPELKKALDHDSKLSLKDVVSNYPVSMLRRYRLEQGKPLEVKFEPNESLKQSHPNLQIEWLRPDGIPSKTFVFQEVEPNSFSVQARPDAGVEKVLAVFRDGEEIIGSRPFYFGTE